MTPFLHQVALELMRAAGYRCEDVCYDWTAAARAVCGYLGVDAAEYGIGAAARVVAG